MTMTYQPPSLIGASNATVNNAFLPPIKYARAAGSVMKYDYKSSKPKKQVKEMVKILWPEKKTFLKMPIGFKFNTRDRLRQSDIEALSASGWTIRPPQMSVETAEDELFRLTMESHAINNRVISLMTTGTSIIQQSLTEEPLAQQIDNVFLEGVE